MVPVDPLLSEVDAQSGRLTFYYVGALADGAVESAHEVVATVDGGSASGVRVRDAPADHAPPDAICGIIRGQWLK